MQLLDRCVCVCVCCEAWHAALKMFVYVMQMVRAVKAKHLCKAGIELLKGLVDSALCFDVLAALSLFRMRTFCACLVACLLACLPAYLLASLLACLLMALPKATYTIVTDGPSHIAVVAYAPLAGCGAHARGAGGACAGSCWHQHLQQCKASLALGAFGANAQAKVWPHSLCMTARR